MTDQDRVDELAALGRQAAEQGRHDEAARAYGEAVDSGAEWLWRDLGDAHAHLGDTDAAREAYEASAGWGDETAIIRLDALEDGRLTEVIGTGRAPENPLPARREVRSERAARGESVERVETTPWWRSPAGILLLLTAAALGFVIDLLIMGADGQRRGLAIAALLALLVATGWAYMSWGFGPPRRRGGRGAHRR